MAHIETWYRCPVCNRLHDSYADAYKCLTGHPIRPEKWACGKYKNVMIDEHCSGRGGLNWALREADLSDDIYERQRQLEELGERESCKIETETGSRHIQEKSFIRLIRGRRRST